MKKILNGKMYNTETAKRIANRSYSNPRDFNYVSETLYRKKTGEFFLYGEGGAMTTYSIRTENGWSGGDEFIPLSEGKARKWMETYCDADEYIEVFGEPEE